MQVAAPIVSLRDSHVVPPVVSSPAVWGAAGAPMPMAERVNPASLSPAALHAGLLRKQKQQRCRPMSDALSFVTWGALGGTGVGTLMGLSLFGVGVIVGMPLGLVVGSLVGAAGGAFAAASHVHHFPAEPHVLRLHIFKQLDVVPARRHSKRLVRALQQTGALDDNRRVAQPQQINAALDTVRVHFHPLSPAQRQAVADILSAMQSTQGTYGGS